MKTLFYIVLVTAISIVWGCNSSKKTVAEEKTVTEKTPQRPASDSIWIANPELKYEILIIDGGFNPWLQSTAKPRNFYTQAHLESRIAPWVIEWNNKYRSPKKQIGPTIIYTPNRLSKRYGLWL